ncbi:MAG: toxin-antitoxin system toxin subunit [Demequinaceae bacterium]|nr:toxin-antitoxin system toxin subunit [Demequinaceae bacterium]
MTTVTLLDNEDVARACARHGVLRLRVFGSLLTGHFDVNTSDLDFLVEFEPGLEHPFDAYFGLNEELESLLGRHFDLVMAEAVRNPYFAASVFDSALDVYAA